MLDTGVRMVLSRGTACLSIGKYLPNGNITIFTGNISSRSLVHGDKHMLYLMYYMITVVPDQKPKQHTVTRATIPPHSPHPPYFVWLKHACQVHLNQELEG
jgi:hypothetical protein